MASLFFALSPFRPFALSPFRPFALSPFRPFALSPFRPFALSPFRQTISKNLSRTWARLPRKFHGAQSPRARST